MVEVMNKPCYLFPVWGDCPFAAVTGNLVCAFILPTNAIRNIDFAWNVPYIHDIMR